MSSSSRGRNTERFVNTPWSLARKHQSQELGWAHLGSELSARCACPSYLSHSLGLSASERGRLRSGVHDVGEQSWGVEGWGPVLAGPSANRLGQPSLHWLFPSLPHFPPVLLGGRRFLPWHPCLRSASEGTRPETPPQARCSAGHSHMWSHLLLNGPFLIGRPSWLAGGPSQGL